jgi:hypothetical protein
MNATKRCRYCEDGNVPNEKGDHWIVKSIFPSKINIRRCLKLPPKHDLRAQIVSLGADSLLPGWKP